MDWKLAIDADIERKEREAKAKQEAAEAQRLQEKLQREAQEKAERRRKIAELGRKFSCHVCGRKAQVPSEKEIRVGFVGIGRDAERSTGDIRIVEDWERPADLWGCDRCGKWTCEEHLHQGVCKKCGERLARK